MPIVSFTNWNQFLSSHPNTHLLQTGEWGELKSAFGWKPIRIINGNTGMQILFRKLPLGFTVGYIPKSVIRNQLVSDQFWDEIDSVCREHRAIFLKLEPDLWNDSPLPRGEGRVRVSPHNIQ